MINNEEIKKITSIEEVRYLKSLAVSKQMYELAAYAREQEKFLMTDEGKMWSIKEIAKLKSKKRKEKLERIFLSDK